jgi:hypothetical protein
LRGPEKWGCFSMVAGSPSIHPGIKRNVNDGMITNLVNETVTYDNSLVEQNSFPVHGNDVHPNECRRAALACPFAGILGYIRLGGV